MSKSCPYPGLRPFKEEEAIYFKGREEHIKKIANALYENKYLMITGASGDGKSSVVYAGLIPYAKAGFIKSKHNNWKLVIFKPGNSPYHNLCSALANTLGLDINFLKKELKYGFSSLVKIYKESSYHIDESSDKWRSKSVDERLESKRSAANLLILVDQFEEFFTHSENYQDNIPSDEAYLVMNLITDTVRVAQQEDLPIYITSTMRADFMGNCAMYRGLPELIGQSNFFLPRLKREEIQDIVCEPALLNGDTIENRLAEYLINASNEGADQLPILQHCMNRTWNIANEMGTSMDLIQLGRASGIDSNELPFDLKNEIVNWKSTLPTSLHSCFEEASINNIINFHAESLLQSIIKQAIKANSKLTEDEILSECHYFFQSITKFDEGRPVRFLVKYNRLKKNSKIPEIIDLIINEFGGKGNSLLNLDLNGVKEKQGDVFIDINHEALIRNWKRLKDWANEDGAALTNFLDLKKQTIRWIDNKKDKSFLLPLGSLTFFEDFVKKSGLHLEWILKYETDYSIDEIKELQLNILSLLSDSRNEIEFIEAQRKKRRKTIIASAITVVLILSVLTVWALSQKSLAEEQTSVAENQTKEAEKSKKDALLEKEKAQNAEQEAQKQKEVALSNEKIANDATVKAEQSKNEALNSYSLAKRNEELAKQQTRKAEEAEKTAMKERDIATSEKEKSEKQRLETNKLLQISRARNVLKKAAYPFNDEQLNYLLATEAYSRLKQNEETSKIFSQEVFEGLSYLIQNEDNATKNLGLSGSINYFSLYNNDSGNGFISVSNGDVNVLDLDGKKKHSFKYDEFLKIYTIEVSGLVTLIQKTSREISIHNKEGDVIAKSSSLDGFVEQFAYHNGVGYVRTDNGKVYLIEKKDFKLVEHANKIVYVTHNSSDFLCVDNKGDLYRLEKENLLDRRSSDFEAIQATIFSNKLIWINSKGILERQKIDFSEIVEIQGLNTVVLKMSSSDSYFGILYGNNQVHVYTYYSEDPVILSFSKSKISDIMIVDEYLYVVNDKKKVMCYDLNLDRLNDKVRSKTTRELKQEEISKYFEGKSSAKTRF